MKGKATPFDMLTPQHMKHLPATQGSTVVVAGVKVTHVQQIDELLVDAARDDDQAIAEARRLANDLRKSKRAAREAAYRQTPERQAYIEAWRAANKAKLAAARKRWVKANPDKASATTRRYYANHLEQQRQRARDRYHARKAAAVQLGDQAGEQAGEQP